MAETNRERDRQLVNLWLAVTLRETFPRYRQTPDLELVGIADILRTQMELGQDHQAKAALARLIDDERDQAVRAAREGAIRECEVAIWAACWTLAIEAREIILALLDAPQAEQGDAKTRATREQIDAATTPIGSTQPQLERAVIAAVLELADLLEKHPNLALDADGFTKVKLAVKALQAQAGGDLV